MNGGHSSGNIWWRYSAAIFRWLLRLYPRQFRDAYGSQMVEDFRDLWEEAALNSGVIGVCQLCWGTLGDLVATAIAERLRKDQAVERGIMTRVSAVVVWATAVFAALSVLGFTLLSPFNVYDSNRWVYFVYWTFSMVFLVGLCGLHLNYRLRAPWYIWLIGGATTIAFFCWQCSGLLLSILEHLLPGGFPSAEQAYPIFFAIYVVYSIGMLVWGFSALIKAVLPRWTAVLLVLFGVDSLLMWAFVWSAMPADFPNDIRFGALGLFPSIIYRTEPYALVRCVLLLGLGYALWVNNRPKRETSEQNGASPTPQRFAEGVDPAM